MTDNMTDNMTEQDKQPNKEQNKQKKKSKSLMGGSSHHKSSHQKDEFVSVTVRKDTEEGKKAKVGIKLVLQDNGRVRVSAIAKNGLFADTEVEVGDTLLSVNGKRLRPGEGAEALMSVITNTPKAVTCVVKKANAVSRRPAKSQSLLRNNSAHEANDNNVTTQQRYRGVARHNKDGSLAFDRGAATANGTPAMQQLTATVVKDEKEDDVGIALVVKDGALLIASIDKLSPFQDTPLQLHDKVVSINDMNFLRYADATYATRIVEKAAKHVTIVVERAGSEAPAKRTRPAKKASSSSSNHSKLPPKNPSYIKSKKSQGWSSIVSDNTTSTTATSDENSIGSMSSTSDDANNSNNSTPIVQDNPSIHMAVANATTRIQRVGITAPKRFEKQEVGLVMKKVKSCLVVDEIHAKSIFQGTSLQVGDCVLSINNTSFDGAKISVKKAQQTLHDSKETVVLVVEKRQTDFHLNESFTMDGSQNLVW